MITTTYVRVMAVYNRRMNESLYASAARLTDKERRADRGAFWKSIHGTLVHLLWADRIQMSRLAGWQPPSEHVRESGIDIRSFAELTDERSTLDTDIVSWADALSPQDLDGELRWYSGSQHRHVTTSRALLAAHLFNHQTHHRGQVHALLTRAGAPVGDTDLWLVMEDAARPPSGEM